MLEEPKNPFAHPNSLFRILYSDTRFAKRPYRCSKTHFPRIRVSTPIPVEYGTIEQGIWMFEETYSHIRIHGSAILYSETRFAKQPYPCSKTHFPRIRVSTPIPLEYRTIEQGIWMLEEPKNQFAHPNSLFRHSVFRYTVCKAAVFILKNPLYSDQSKHDNSSRIQNNRTRNLDVRRTKKPIRTSEFTVPRFMLPWDTRKHRAYGNWVCISLLDCKYCQLKFSTLEI